MSLNHPMKIYDDDHDDDAGLPPTTGDYSTP